MANETIRILIDILTKGQGSVKQAADAIKQLEGEGKRSQSTFAGMKVSYLAWTGAVGAAALAAKKAYDTIRQGAQLQTTQQRFQKLADSIGTTADVMLGKLREATQGMVSDFDLMASASQIISLRLADNEDQVIRLATVVGTLGWDMQQVILTFANMSTMRLDALGLSVEEVKNKAKELEKSGMSAQAAFKEAVIQAGEMRLDVGGVSDAEQSFKMAEAAVRNFKDSLLLSTAATLEQVGAFNILRQAAENLNNFTTTEQKLYALYEAGKLTEPQYKSLVYTLQRGGAAAVEARLGQELLATALQGTSNEVLYNLDSWRRWAVGVAITNSEAAAASEAATDAIITNIGLTAAAIDEALAMWGDVIEHVNAVAGVMDNIKTAKFKGGLADLAKGYGKVAEETRSYGYAVSSAMTAEDALAASHARLADTFMSEFGQKAEDGLINESGVVNIENANKALLEQAKIAGATASQLAMLGLATGAMSEEQAAAALKAAILMEKARQIAQYAVATGDIGGAAGAWTSFQEQINSGQIDGAAGNIEALTGAAQELAEGGPYTAELIVENQAAMATITDTVKALNNLISGNYNIAIGVGAPSSGGTPVGGGGNSDRAGFGVIGRVGPEVLASGSSPVSGGQTREVINGRSGGASNSITVNNYIQGGSGSTRGLQTAVEDGTFAALKRVGIGGNR